MPKSNKMSVEFLKCFIPENTTFTEIILPCSVIHNILIKVVNGILTTKSCIYPYKFIYNITFPLTLITKE